MRWYVEDSRTGRVHSQAELVQIANECGLTPADVRRRFRILPEGTCRLLEQVERIANVVDTGSDRRRPSAGS